MPIYDYMCDECGLGFEVVESIKVYTGKATCTACGKDARRVFTCNVHFTGTKIEDAEFNPGLGKITKSKRHRDELAKRMDVVEVGNEKPETIHKHFDQDRETKRKKSWENV